MNRLLITILILLGFNQAFACSCDMPLTTLEFYSSDIVFEGRVISKIYAEDSLTYTATLEIIKNYKNQSQLQTVTINRPAEGEITGTFTSCDWHIKLGETWLIYAELDGSRISFDYMCSNSMPTSSRKINQYDQKILDNGKDLDLQKFFIEDDFYFNPVNPKLNFDSIVSAAKPKDYENELALIDLAIDEKGKLINLASRKSLLVQKDSIFGLPISFSINKDRINNQLERDAVELLSQFDTWEIKRHNKTNLPVKYFQGVVVRYNKKENSWTYELVIRL
ncbi:hypothetical protein ACFCT7_02985 [Fulvivirgaceae bacterium LMO-SS25]